MKSEQYAIDCLAHLLCGGPAPVNPPDKRLYLSLHEYDPAVASDQSLFEIDGVGRVAIEWSKAEWGNDGVTFFNKNKKIFPRSKATNAKQVARFWGLGYAASGKGELKISGKLKDEQEIVGGMIIECEAGNLRTREF